MIQMVSAVVIARHWFVMLGTLEDEEMQFICYADEQYLHFLFLVPLGQVL